jgi:hypothetical protein
MRDSSGFSADKDVNICITIPFIIKKEAWPADNQDSGAFFPVMAIAKAGFSVFLLPKA